MTDLADLDGYIAECERKIAALEARLERVESRLAATITIATREATLAVAQKIQEAMSDA